MAYINTVNFNDRWSFWNDYHYVPTSFTLYRLGLTYETKNRFRFTTGYAHVFTATPISSALKREEHRYWGQIVKNIQANERLRFNLRFRYDFRFRETLNANGAIVNNDFRLNYRWRLSNNTRFKITKPQDGKFYHVDLMNELLYNTGKYLTPGIDQMRNFLLFGYTNPKMTILAGYSNRFVPAKNSNPWVMNHGFVLWINHRLRWPHARHDNDIL